MGAPNAAIESTRNGMWFLRHLSDTAFHAYGPHSVGLITPPAGTGYGGAIAIGLGDVAVGAPNGGTGGTLTLTSLGAPMQITNNLTQADISGLTPEAGDQFGASLAVADLDGDGNDDLVVGSRGENSGQGIVALFHGGTILTGWTWRGEKDDGLTPAAASDGFGTAVAAGMSATCSTIATRATTRPATSRWAHRTA